MSGSRSFAELRLEPFFSKSQRLLITGKTEEMEFEQLHLGLSS